MSDLKKFCSPGVFVTSAMSAAGMWAICCHVVKEKAHVRKDWRIPSHNDLLRQGMKLGEQILIHWRLIQRWTPEHWTSEDIGEKWEWDDNIRVFAFPILKLFFVDKWVENWVDSGLKSSMKTPENKRLRYIFSKLFFYRMLLAMAINRSSLRAVLISWRPKCLTCSKWSPSSRFFQTKSE